MYRLLVITILKKRKGYVELVQEPSSGETVFIEWTSILKANNRFEEIHHKEPLKIIIHREFGLAGVAAYIQVEKFKKARLFFPLEND